MSLLQKYAKGLHLCFPCAIIRRMTLSQIDPSSPGKWRKMLMQKQIITVMGALILLGFVSMAEALNDDPSLMLYLPFEEGKGDVTVDQSGNGIEGVLKGAEWTKDGKIGNALSFQGAAHVEFPEVPELNITKAITLEAWIFPLNVQGDSNLFGRRTPANQGGYTMQWTAGKIETWVHIGGWQGTRGRQTITPKTGEWHHVVGVYDGSTVRQYVDGELDIEFGQKGEMGSVPQVFRVGQAQTGLESMGGIIDEVAVYERALTEEEILSDMQNGVIFSVSPKGKLTTMWGSLKRSAFF
jgi:hypothetical protein